MLTFEKLLSIMTKPLGILFYFLFVLLSFLFLDIPIATMMRDLDLSHAVPILHWITFFGKGWFYLIPLFILAIFFRYVYRQKTYEMVSWFLWGCALVPSLFCLVIKIVLSRARPGLFFSEQLYGFYWFKTNAIYWSFPSGHTATVMGFAFGLWVLFGNLGALFFIPGLLIVFSRVFLIQHFLSDILAATYLSLVSVGLVIWWFRNRWLMDGKTVLEVVAYSSIGCSLNK